MGTPVRNYIYKHGLRESTSIQRILPTELYNIAKFVLPNAQKAQELHISYFRNEEKKTKLFLSGNFPHSVLFFNFRCL